MVVNKGKIIIQNCFWIKKKNNKKINNYNKFYPKRMYIT